MALTETHLLWITELSLKSTMDLLFSSAETSDQPLTIITISCLAIAHVVFSNISISQSTM